MLEHARRLRASCSTARGEEKPEALEVARLVDVEAALEKGDRKAELVRSTERLVEHGRTAPGDAAEDVVRFAQADQVVAAVLRRSEGEVGRRETLERFLHDLETEMRHVRADHDAAARARRERFAEGREHARPEVRARLLEARARRKTEPFRESVVRRSHLPTHGEGRFPEAKHEIAHERFIECSGGLVADPRREPCLHPSRDGTARKHDEEIARAIHAIDTPTAASAEQVQVAPRTSAARVGESTMITTGELKRGQRILIDKDPFVVLDLHVQSPSARGASSLTKIRARNLRTGQMVDKTFRGGDRIEEPNLELRGVQFLYRDGDEFHFMDKQSYDQFSLKSEDLGDAAGFLKEGLESIRSVVFNGQVISVDLPNTVVLQVVETAPAIKGATAQAQTKAAKLETGIEIQVPSYLESGELVLVDTRDSRFVSRAKS